MEQPKLPIVDRFYRWVVRWFPSKVIFWCCIRMWAEVQYLTNRHNDNFSIDELLDFYGMYIDTGHI